MQPQYETDTTAVGPALIERILNRDYTVWGDDPHELANRLGWVDCPEKMAEAVPDLTQFATEVVASGVEDVVVLGMGGSSLAAEVFQEVCGNAEGYPRIRIIDTTDPLTIHRHSLELDTGRTLFVVATKSGGTVETFSLFKYFFNLTRSTLGKEVAANQFVAITDPGSTLERIARGLEFRRVFLNDPDIGGRYSALSLFGLVPAALAGIDIMSVLQSAQSAKSQASAELGMFIGEQALAGRNKLTLIADESVKPLTAWIEQLVAESTGKHGKGILPVSGSAAIDAKENIDDRCFVTLEESASSPATVAGDQLMAAGYPVFHTRLTPGAQIGGHFFDWELATAVACRIIGVNPFDQPDVESAKVTARAAMDQFSKSGSLPELTYAAQHNGIRLAGEAAEAGSLSDTLRGLAQSVPQGGYLCLQAFLPSLPEVEQRLARLASAFGSLTSAPVAWGLGPRYLHSTGQLHKGGPDGGVFIQLTCRDEIDLPVPDDAEKIVSSYNFGTLKQAQAIGDYMALNNAGRRVASLHLPEYLTGLDALIAALS